MLVAGVLLGLLLSPAVLGRVAPSYYNLLFIDGVRKLKGCMHTILPDMIEIGSFIGMAAMTEFDAGITLSWVSILRLIKAGSSTEV